MSINSGKWYDGTYELPCHSWKLIGPLVVSAWKLGTVCPKRILKYLDS